MTVSRITSILAATAINMAATAAFAETHAVIVGIDNYTNIRHLSGATADAKDIFGALQRRGVRDVKLLLDQDATRDRVLGELNRMIDRTTSGDLVIVSFAGHGSQETWGKAHPQGVSQGAKHEVFLLTNVIVPDSEGRIDRKRSGSASERIAGTEMNAKLKALEAKGARTIFVADTCHGGGLTRRPYFGQGEPPTFRFLPPLQFADGQDPLAETFSRLPAPVDTDRELQSLTFLAGVDNEHSVLEYEIPSGSGKRRGALSYAFARAIEGEVKSGRPGFVTRGELIAYIRTTVRTHTENSQFPDLRPRADWERVVIDAARDLAATETQDKTDISKTVKIFDIGADPVTPSHGRKGDLDIRPSTSKDDADLIFDANRHEVYSATGELVANDIESVDKLPAIAEREVALRRLLALARPRPHAIKLAEADNRYLKGDHITVDARPSESEPRQAEHYLLFDINGSGLVQFLYPVAKYDDPLILPLDKPLAGIDARKPFGADTLVLVTSSKPLAGLVLDIGKLDGREAALDVVDILESSLASTPDMRIGLQRLYTAPSITAQ
jgi:Caspase domain